MWKTDKVSIKFSKQMLRNPPKQVFETEEDEVEMQRAGR
jgi:hypothetical protein